MSEIESLIERGKLVVGSIMQAAHDRGHDIEAVRARLMGALELIGKDSEEATRLFYEIVIFVYAPPPKQPTIAKA